MKTKVTEFKTKKIEKLTGGLIKTFEIPNYPKTKEDDGKLRNTFMSSNGNYIGDYARGWWYVTHNLKVCEDNSSICAELWSDGYKEHIGYVGYSHRGSNTFKIGDRLFDQKYKPVKEDYSEEEWNGWLKQQSEAIKKDIEMYKDDNHYNEKMATDENPIKSFIPFNKRGSKTIETMEEAKQAAINLGSYLS